MKKTLYAVFCALLTLSTLFASQTFASDIALSDLSNSKISLKSDKNDNSRYVDISIENQITNDKRQQSLVTIKLDKMDDSTLTIKFHATIKIVKFSEMKSDRSVANEQYLFIPSVLRGCQISGCQIFKNDRELSGEEFKAALDRIMFEDDSQGMFVKLPSKENLLNLITTKRALATLYFNFGNFDKTEAVNLNVADTANRVR